MNLLHSVIISASLVLIFVVSALAGSSDIFTRKIHPAKNLLIFPNTKGEVIFSHLKHLHSLSEDQCILCHRVDNPTIESIQTRFDNHRVAHTFCKGCHREMGKGPTECHQCHNYRKTADRQ